MNKQRKLRGLRRKFESWFKIPPVDGTPKEMEKIIRASSWRVGSLEVNSFIPDICIDVTILKTGDESNLIETRNPEAINRILIYDPEKKMCLNKATPTGSGTEELSFDRDIVFRSPSTPRTTNYILKFIRETIKKIITDRQLHAERIKALICASYSEYYALLEELDLTTETEILYATLY